MLAEEKERANEIYNKLMNYKIGGEPLLSKEE